MKRLLLIVLPLLLIVGCSKEPINYETTLVERESVFYTQDTNEPYSGPVFSLYEDEKKKEEGTYKDGKPDGLWTYWYNDGQKKGELTFKDGKLHGTQINWYRNGQKEYEWNYKDGERDGLITSWDDNGQKRFEGTYKDGNLISKKRWNEDGSVKE